MTADLLTHAADLLRAARPRALTAPDTLLVSGTSVSVQRRKGMTEETERAEARELGLRVFVGQQSAIVSASAIDPLPSPAWPSRPGDGPRRARRPFFLDPRSPAALRRRLPGPRRSQRTLNGNAHPPRRRGGGRRDVGPRHHQFRGRLGKLGPLACGACDQPWFRRAYTRSSQGISATAIAGSGTGMQRDYDYSSASMRGFR